MTNYDPTRMMTSGSGSSSAPAGATLQMQAEGSDPLRTQMGGTVTCPVCKAVTPLHELYCSECGFLLTSAPPETDETPLDEPPIAELVDTTDGRRFRLRAGATTVGRQGADILVSEGTVSRVHARIVIDGPSIVIEDLGSSNGTKVGDQRITPNTPVPVVPGTPLRFGNWHARIEVPEGAQLTVAMDVDGGPGDSAVEFAAAPESDFASAAAAGPIAALLRRQKGPSGDIPLTDGVVTVGRKAENVVALSEDPFVSGRHVEIATDSTGSRLMDAGSTNGTLINGRRIPARVEHPLNEGDEVTIGQTVYVFTLSVPEAFAYQPGADEDGAVSADAPTDEASLSSVESESRDMQP